LEIDLARAQLIRDLQQDLGINDEGIAVVLDLVDQIGGLRQVLRGILQALQAQPDTIRRQIADEIRGTSPNMTPN
jgi:chaperone modulatory protein CbpM